MPEPLNVALIGDRDDAIAAHGAIERALPAAGERLAVRVHATWIASDAIGEASRLGAFDALWCVPGSPYRSEAGVLAAIRHAREAGQPLLGTCGGMQHLVLEYARHVLGWADAAHGEIAPEATRQVVAPLPCRLVEAAAPVRFVAGSRVARACAEAAPVATVRYRCSFGVNPAFEADLFRGALRPAAFDAEDGAVRAVELDGHPFFVGTLFQPERAALQGERVPLAEAWLRAARQEREMRQGRCARPTGAAA